MKRSILHQALNIARKNISNHPQINHFPHFSFVVQDNKIVEWATNVAKCPPLHYGYDKEDERYKPKTHAETEAYRKAKGKLNRRKPFKVINIRMNKRGELRLSKPCPFCHNILSCLGCSHFYYTNEQGFVA